MFDPSFCLDVSSHATDEFWHDDQNLHAFEDAQRTDATEVTEQKPQGEYEAHLKMILLTNIGPSCQQTTTRAE